MGCPTHLMPIFHVGSKSCVLIRSLGFFGGGDEPHVCFWTFLEPLLCKDILKVKLEDHKYSNFALSFYKCCIFMYLVSSFCMFLLAEKQQSISQEPISNKWSQSANIPAQDCPASVHVFVWYVLYFHITVQVQTPRLLIECSENQPTCKVYEYIMCKQVCTLVQHSKSYISTLESLPQHLVQLKYFYPPFGGPINHWNLNDTSTPPK